MQVAFRNGQETLVGAAKGNREGEEAEGRGGTMKLMKGDREGEGMHQASYHV